MTFNGSDKANSIVADIDFLLFGDGETFNTDYSLTDRTRNVNITWDEAIAELYKADPNHKWDDTTNTDFPIATLTLVPNQDHYTLLDSALVVHRVRIMDRNGKYMTLTPVNRVELTDSELEATGSPDKYYKLGGAIFPVPIPDYGATDGVELEFQRGANYFTISDTNKVPGFNPQYHQFLSIGAALRYASSNGMKNKTTYLSGEKERIRTTMREHYQLRALDERPRLRLRRANVRRYGL